MLFDKIIKYKIYLVNYHLETVVRKITNEIDHYKRTKLFFHFVLQFINVPVYKN